MDDAHLPLFIDTNCFLHLQDFKQIRWRDLFPKGEKIALFVCQAVISELDKHKMSTNRRRRDRARRALTLIEAAADAPGMAIEIRDKNPQIELVIWRGKPDWEDYPDLDKGNPDDYLVAAAGSGDGDGIVFSHDTGPRIRARMMEVKAISPLPDWLLPAEQTDDQRKMSELERELSASKNAKPQLKIALPPDDPMVINVWSVPPLGQALSDKLTRMVLEDNPPVQVAVQQIGRGRIYLDPYEVGQSQADAYHEEYAVYRSKVATYFATLHEAVERHARAQYPDGTIINVGSVSAKGLILSVTVSGNLELVADRDDAEKIYGPITPPQPPKAPSRIRELAFPYHALHKVAHRNPTGFYWERRPEMMGSTEAILHCADFRPGCEEELSVLVRATTRSPCHGKMSVLISAEHHAELEDERLILFESGFGQWLDPRIQVILPDEVRDAFARLDREELPKW